MTSPWKAVLGVILIFVFGCITGSLVTSIAWHKRTNQLLQHPEMLVDVFEKRMTRNLALDPTQQQQIHQYFQGYVQDRRQLQMGIQPQVQMLNRQTLQEITAVLRPDQKTLFHQNVEDFRKRWGRSVFNPNAENPPGNVPLAPPGNPPPPPPR